MSSTIEHSASLTPGASLAEKFWRYGHSSSADVRIDLAWLFGFGVLLVATGIGLREPWPADEPRFVLVARDMLASGQWLFPSIGGDLYADKPPLYFWMLAACIRITGSIEVGFLLPSLFASLGTVALIYDVTRRLWDREAALSAGLLLLLTFQFVWQGRQAQIDALSCFWITLSLYGLMRHLLAGPAWRWYAIGWGAAGLGVITKGVGFLPLLLVPIYFIARRKDDRERSVSRQTILWWLGPIAFVGAIGIWLVPMLLGSSEDPDLRAYRDDILFHQTVDRYAAAWMHQKPPWYYITEVIPPLWLPLIGLVPWLWSYWRAAFKRRDLRIVMPLVWIVCVVVFFSVSAGKRGVYVLPAVPALALAAAPFLQPLLVRSGVKRLFIVLGSAIPIVAAIAFVYLLFDAQRREQVESMYGIAPQMPLLVMSMAGALVFLFTRKHPLWTYAVNLALLLIMVGCWVYPAMDASRSGARFMSHVETLARDVSELGLVSYKEQYLLQSSRPTFNFGHARWRKPGDEAADAAAWLAADASRALLVTDEDRIRCFTNTEATVVEYANEATWYLVRGTPNADCALRGDLRAARLYTPVRSLLAQTHATKPG